MNRALLIASPLLLGLLFAGCWVTWDDDCGSWPGSDCYGFDDTDYDTDDCWYWGDCSDPDDTTLPGEMSCVPGEIRYCDTPTYCSWGIQTCRADGAGWSPCLEGSAPPGCDGFMYDPDCCVDSGSCCQDWYDEDNDGDINDSIGNCEEIPTCSSDTDCRGGYCNIGEGELEGVCVTTSSCDDDADCAVFGPGLACDDRGICVPEDAPCPSGECGCVADSDCDDGMMCLNSRCTPPDTVCFFDFECGAEGTCVDNECHKRCECDAVCPSGQTCQGNICLEPAEGVHGCVFDEDCAESGFRCINATCFATCEGSEECGPNEICRAGACRADTTPTHQCLESTDCSEGLSCHRGFCRLPCAADLNCSGDFPTCGPEGYCINNAEVSFECTRAADCAEGQSCQGNTCH